MTQTHIILVRHGEAASSWSEHPDPGLSSDGITQAKNVSEEFTENFLLMNYYLAQKQEPLKL
jgi:broad specificity phosphatase PhoE